ncbi:SpoIIE family protein phosphatase [bacterium]|nr:SpoIIE family protein phosphatase [bacterium]
MTRLSADRLARQDILSLREMSARLRGDPTLQEVFDLFLLMLMGRFQLRRIALYIQGSEPTRLWLFHAKGQFPSALPDVIESDVNSSIQQVMLVKDMPVLNPGGMAGRNNLGAAWVLKWQGGGQGGQARCALVYLGVPPDMTFSNVDSVFLELLSRTISRALEGNLGRILDRLRDLERRGDLILQGGAGRRKQRLTREKLLDSRNLQTLQDIAFRFKSGVSLEDIFNTYLLTLMGRLRLKRTALYVSTLPASAYQLLLWKGKEAGEELPDRMDMPDLPPRDSLWLDMKTFPDPVLAGRMAASGYSVVWMLWRSAPVDARGAGPPRVSPDALVFMGGAADLTFQPSDVKFMEILNVQITNILTLLDSMGDAGPRPIAEWDKNISVLIRDRAQAEDSLSGGGIAHRVVYRPSHKVGGDFYDFHRFADGSVGVAVADVVGHGIAAAIWTSAMREHLREIVNRPAAGSPPEPAWVLEELNRVLIQNLKNEIPLSICYGVVDPARNLFTYASAGIDFPLLIRPNSDKIFELPAGGLFLGCLPDARFSQESAPIQRDDILLIYTDGFQPAFTARWRRQILQEVQGQGSLDSLDLIAQQLQILADRRMADDDDKTAVLLRLSSAPASAPSDGGHRIDLPSDVRHLPALRLFMDNVLAEAVSVSPDDYFAITFTTEDAVVNAIQHGYQSVPTGTVTIDVSRREGRLSVAVRDAGCGFEFDPASIPKFAVEDELYRDSGRGLYMMHQLMDGVEITSRPASGTSVLLTKRLRGDSARGA